MSMTLEMALQDFIFSMEVRKLSPRTIANYQKQVSFLIRFAKDRHGITTLDKMTGIVIKEFLAMKNATCKPQYVNDLLKAFKVFFRYVKDEGYISDILTDRIKNVKQPKVKLISFNAKEIKSFLDYFSGRDFLSARNQVMFAMFFDTGVRCAELCNMQPSQIKQDYILVFGKGGKERIVPITPYLGKLLIRYINARTRYLSGEDCAFLFFSKNRKVMTEEGISHIMKDTATAIHVRPEVRVSPHTCRHTYAHMQLRNGCNIYTLARLLGHENIAITQRYLEGIQDEEIIAVGRQISPLMNL